MKYLIIAILSFFSTQASFGQSKLYGSVRGGEGVQNVNIKIPELQVSTTTNIHGIYELLNLPRGKYNIVFSHVGYKTNIQSIQINENESYELNIVLEKKIIKLGETVVVSPKSDFFVKDTALPIELVQQEKIQSSSQISISDILKRENGISIVKDGPWATTVNVRGLSKQNLVYLIDGNRIETSTNIAAGLSLMDMNDFESVEVVKGGLSSLYGTGATGGVINIQSKEARFDSTPYLSSQIISSYNSVNNGYSSYLNIKTGGNNWSAKINGSLRNADDLNTPQGILENSSFKDENIAASLKYSPIENLIVNLDFQKFSAYDVGIPGGAPFPKQATATYKYANRELFSPSIILNNISKYLIKTKLKYYLQTIGRSVEIKPNPMVTANPKADHITNGFSIQSDWVFNKKNYLVTGIEYWQREYDGLRTVTNLAKNVISVDKPVPNSKFGSLGVFVRDDIKLSDDFRISVSGRYDFIKITNDETKNPQYIISNGTKNVNVRNELASYEKYDETNKSMSGGIGTIYKLSSNYDLVLNIGYNFRSPSLEERYQYIDLGGIVYLGNPELKPEEGIFVDAGFRVWQENITLRFNGFINSFTNLVLDDVLVPDSIYIKNNIGESRLYGFDTRIDYNFYKNYLVYASAAFVVGEDISLGTNLPQIPPFNGITGIILPISSFMKADVSVTFASDQNKTGLGENRTGGFTYYDLSLASEPFQFGVLNFKVIAGIQNIFDRGYREHLSTYRGINRLEPGRNIFAKIIIDFK